MRRIKLWTKTHPGEQLAEDFASSLEVNYVDIGVVNELGSELGKRIVNMNMMKAYPGDKTATVYEKRRAAEVLEESQGYNHVIDLHSLRQHGEAAGVISAKRGVSPRVLGFFRSLSMNNLIVDDRVGMHPHLDDAFVVEMSAALYNNAERLRHGLDALANDPDPPREVATSFNWFKFVDSLHVSHFDPRTANNHLEQMVSYQPLPPTIDRQIKRRDPSLVGQVLYAMAWSEEPNDDGYWGEIVTPIKCPDTSGWPTEVAPDSA